MARQPVTRLQVSGYRFLLRRWNTLWYVAMSGCSMIRFAHNRFH